MGIVVGWFYLTRPHRFDSLADLELAGCNKSAFSICEG